MNLFFSPAPTKHPAAENGLHPKSFQSWRWVFLAAMLLATVAISTVYFSSAQAQENKRSITGLTLTSEAPGTLTVSWDTVRPVPTDYRVNWAKSSEDYPSWTSDHGNLYPAGTATTVTITGLEHGTEYKIRMRARYYEGEKVDSSGSGPWAKASLRVAGNPEPTPTPEPAQGEEESTPEPGTIIVLTATDDAAGRLVLSWEPPAAPHAEPTDYHVNWAKSTDEYPSDTNENGNAHPATATHTLAGLDYDTDYNVRVRARYTDGENADSPWSGPWTETTAQVSQPLPAAPSIMGTAVTPEGQVLLLWQNPSDDSITGYQVLRGPDADSLVVIVEDTGSSSTTYTDTEPPAGQTHTYGVKARNSSGLSPRSNTVTATVPESEPEEELITAQQSEEQVLVSNLDTSTSASQISASQNRETRRYAQTFSAANNADGTQATFDFDGVTFGLTGSGTGNVAASHLVVTVNTDNSGEPGSVLYTLTSATTSLSLHIDDRREFTFNAPADATLTSGVTYWLVFAAATGSTYFDGNYLFIHITSDDSEVQGTATVNHWSIGDTSRYNTASSTWLTEQRVMSLAILGAQRFDTLVSNIGQPYQGAHPLGLASKVAQSFLTPPGRLGQQYRLHRVRINAASLEATRATTDLHADDNGSPGNHLTSMIMPDDFAPGDEPTNRTDLIAVAPRDTFLNPKTRYWLVFSNEPEFNHFHISLTESKAEDATSLDGWKIGDRRALKAGDQRWLTSAFPIQMELIAHRSSGPTKQTDPTCPEPATTPTRQSQSSPRASSARAI